MLKSLLLSLIVAAFAVSARSTPLNTDIMKREVSGDWSKLLGPDNIPREQHLKDVWEEIKRRGIYESLHEPTNTPFWAVLWALTKCSPKGKWIKSMFDQPEGSEDGEDGTIVVQLFHKSDGANGPSNADPVVLKTKDIEDPLAKDGAEDWKLPLWPLVLGQALYQLGWQPMKDVDHPVEDLLEWLTGYKAKGITMENKTKDDYFDAIGSADKVPTIANNQGMWNTMLSVNKEDKYLSYIEAPKGPFIGGTVDWDLTSTVVDTYVFSLDDDFDHFKGRP